MGDEAGVLRPGVRLGPYQVREPIGRGGMGAVYRAYDTVLHRDVALKVLAERFLDDPDRLTRFEREARILAALSHPNIAAIYGVERTDAGHQVLILELIEGVSVSTWLTSGGVPVAEALGVARQISQALEAAHDRGIIHRDLKPDNIKIRPDGAIKVFDFGIAKALQRRPGAGGEPETAWSEITQPGVVMGTAAYMSSEQVCGEDVDQRTDIWAFGVILFEMLAGQRPFTGDSVVEVLAQVLEREPDLDLLPETVPPAVRRLIRRCLQKDLGERFRHIANVRFEIEDLGDRDADAGGSRSAARPSGRPAVWAVVSVLLNVSRVWATALFIPMTFAAVGILTSLVFNRALRIPSTESFFDYVVFGYRAVFPPAIYSIAGAIALIVLVIATSLLAWLAARVWPGNRWRREEKRATTLAIRWLADREPRAFGQAFSALCSLALLALTAVSWRLLSVIARLMVHGPAAGIDVSVLSVSSEPYLELVYRVGSAMVFGLFTVWVALFPWLRQRGADPWVVRLYQWRSLAGILALLLLLSAPWRIAWDHDREPVQFDGRAAFLLTEGSFRVVIYVPGQTPVEVAPSDPRLVRANPATRQPIFPD